MLLRTFKGLIVPAMLIVTGVTHAFAVDSVARFEPVASTTMHNQDRSVVMELLAVAVLENLRVGNNKVTDLSALAWDEDEGVLLAVSDNGYLLHLKPVYDNDTLVDIKLVNGYPLRDKNNQPLQGEHADAEGIAIKQERNTIAGDTGLYISFERVPRIVQYSAEGKYIRDVPLPTELADIANYRGKNSALEALMYSEKLGFLTGPEFPLQTDSAGQLVIYTLDGLLWRILAQDPVYGALVGLEAMEDGRILVLERAYGGPFPGVFTTLHRFDPEDDRLTKKLITLRPEDPVFNNNFEGLTRIRDNLFMMVSDNNDHPLIQTRLIYFRLTIIEED